jgi:hypothetical protein
MDIDYTNTIVRILKSSKDVRAIMSLNQAVEVIELAYETDFHEDLVDCLKKKW